MSRFLSLLFVALIPLLFITQRSQAVDNINQLKSIYVYKIAQFTHWENIDFKTNEEQLSICVFSQEKKLYQAFENISKNYLYQSKKITLNIIDSESKANNLTTVNCHIAYIGSKQKLSDKQIAILKSKNNLIITERDDIRKSFGDLNLLSIDGKLKFQISREREKTSGIKLSTSLLLLATEII